MEGEDDPTMRLAILNYMILDALVERLDLMKVRSLPGKKHAARDPNRRKNEGVARFDPKI